MNVKKMFASLTGVLMLATTVAPMVTGAATYSEELQGAYDYAYKTGITTMSSIDNANMYGELTRGQLAKMIANWAEKELGTKVDETAVCSFTDANKAEGDLATYVKKACQMGLMGQGIDAFRPNDKVTRGEFGTTLSRAMWGDKNNGGTPFYANHLAALKEAGVMNKIDTPNQMEIRGFVMLMLQRATEKVTPAECKDAAVILACALDSTAAACPVACRKTNSTTTTGDVANQGTDVKAGNLEVDVLKTANVVSVPVKGVISMGDVSFAAAGADITLRGVTLERIGLGNNTSVKGIWFEKNGVRVSNKGYLSSDSMTTVSFNPALVLKGSEKLEIVAELNGEVGEEHAFKINAIESSAANLNVKNNTTATLRTTDYKVASVKVSYTNASPVYNMEDGKSYELAKVKVENVSNANQKKVVVKSMLLRNEKNGDVSNLYDIVLYRNGKKVSETAQTLGSREILLTMNDVISSAQSATYSLEAKVKSVDSSDGDTYLFDLRRSEDMTAVEEGTNFRSAISLANADSTKFYTIKGGKILFASDTSLAKNQTVAQEASDVVLLKGTINPKEPVILRDLKLDLLAATTVPTSAIAKIQAKVGSTVINGSFVKNTSDEKAKNLEVAECARRRVLDADVALATVKASCDEDGTIIDVASRKIATFAVADPLTFSAADEVVRKVQVSSFTVATNEVFFDGDFYVNGKSDVEVLVSFNSSADKGKKIQLGNLKLTSFKAGEYQKSQNNIETDGAYKMKGGNGFVAGRTITIGDAKLNLTKASGLVNPKIVNGSSTETVVYEGSLRNSGVEKLRVTDLSLAFDNTATDQIQGSTIVKIGDQSFGPQDIETNKVTHKSVVKFGNLGFDLEAGKTQTIKVAFMLDAIDPMGADIKFNPALTVKVADLQGTESPAIAARPLGEVTITKDADIQFGSATTSISNSLVKVNEEQLVSKFSLTNKNAQTSISRIKATFDAHPTQVVFNVYDSNRNAVVSEYVTPAAGVLFADTNVTDNVLESNKVYTVEVLATFGAAASVNMTKLEFGFDNGALVDAKQTSAINVVSTFPKITLVPTTNKEEILAFEVEAQGDEKLNFDLDAAAVSVAGFDPTTWEKAVVKVNGVEVNANNATKSVEVPANSTVRVAIERGTMEFKGDATKWVLKLIGLSTFKINGTAALGGKLSSSNAANVVFKKVTDGTVVRVDWSDLRGEYTF